MLDINGQELREGATAQLLCEILAIEDGGVLVRIMNSENEYLIGTNHDEVLGGWVADSELTAFEDPRESKLAQMLKEIRSLLPRTDEFMACELPYAVRRYINQLGCRAGDPVAADIGELQSPDHSITQLPDSSLCLTHSK